MKTDFIYLPFVEIKLSGATDVAQKFFRSHFFPISKPKKILFRFELICQQIDQPQKFIQVEKVMIKAGEKCFLRDTRGKLACFNIHELKNNSWQVQIDPDFDWYYFYTFVIESLMMIALMPHQIGFAHASAMSNRKGQAIVFPAWQNTGKTHLMMTLAKHGFHFLSDDYCLIYQGKVFSFPKKINLFSYNFAQFPQVFKHLNLSTKLRIKCSMVIKNLLENGSKLVTGGLAKILYRLSQLAEVSTNIKIHPKELGIEVVEKVDLHKVYLLQRTNALESSVENILVTQLHQQLLTILSYEQREFLHLYQKYRFLFPEYKVELIEQFEQNYQQWLKTNLQDGKKITLGRDLSAVEQELDN